MKDPKAALKWIVAILKKRGVPFQVVGGLAAIAYGVNRKLVDIDLQIPAYGFEKIIGDVSSYKVLGPGRYSDKEWDLNILTLNYDGQIIDLGDADHTRFFNKKANKWEKLTADYSKSETKKVYGINVPVIPKADLIRCKEKLGREVDKIDVAQLSKR